MKLQPSRLLRVVAAAASISAAFSVPAQAQQFQVRPGWPIVLPGTSVDGGLLVDLDGDGQTELVQVAGSTVYAFESDGSAVSGWPRTLDTPNTTFSPPAFGDIDGDGVGEVVLSTFRFGLYGRVWAIERNGTPLPGFPVDLGGTVKAPALGDLDDDGELEILVVCNNSGIGELFALDEDGSVRPGFPRTFDAVGGSGPAVGDLDGDGVPEVVAASYTKLHAFTNTGADLAGFPYVPGPVLRFNYATPTLVDLDGDGDREIVTATCHENNGTGRVHVLEHDGSNANGWPRSTGQWIFTPPSVADVDGDDELDVVVGDQVLSPSPANKVYAWSKDGVPLSGFPISPLDAVLTQVMVADVDGDGMAEVVFDGNVGNSPLFAYNHDGTPTAGWPIALQGSSFQQSPSFADIDGDGFTDMAASGNLISQGQTALYLFTSDVAWDPEDAQVATYQYGPLRDGVADPEGAGCSVTRYCNPDDGSPNNVATLAISSCSLEGTVTIDLANGPANEFAYLVIGDGNNVIQPPGAEGDLCLVGGVCLGRYTKDAGTIDALGTFSTDISNSLSGGPNFGIPTCGGTLQPGETWQFQVWHRQPMGALSTFSEALSVTFD